MANTRKTAAPKASPLDEAVADLDSSKQVTSASSWRAGRKDGMIVPLPSGNVARLRRTMNLVKLLEAGKIPNPLAGAVRKMIQAQSSAVDLKTMPEEAIGQLMELVNSQIPLIWVEPKVQTEPADWDETTSGLWEPDEDCITVDDIDYEDRMFAFGFAQGQAADLASFREAKAAALAGMADVEDVEPAPKSAGGS